MELFLKYISLHHEYFHLIFHSYKVISESNRAGYRPGLVTVDRRYSDFDWLQNEFSLEFPGMLIIPN